MAIFISECQVLNHTRKQAICQLAFCKFLPRSSVQSYGSGIKMAALSVIHCRISYRCIRSRKSYLVSAPIPDGGRGLAEKECGPRHVGGHGISEHHPGILARVSTRVVGVHQSCVWNSHHVAVIELLVAANVDKTWFMYSNCITIQVGPSLAVVTGWAVS